MNLHTAKLSVHIDDPPHRGYWTDGDELTGYIELDAQRDMTVGCIEAQLRCEDRGRAYLQDHEEVVDLTSRHKDETDVLWASHVVSMPLPPSAQDEKAHIAKGQHKFPFHFHLPKDASQLPSSYDTEAGRDCNGTFWGVLAIIDRDHRLKSNYRTFGAICMLPQRNRSFTGEASSYNFSNHEIHLKLHARPAFLLHSGEPNFLRVEARLGVPKEGIIQSPESIDEGNQSHANISLALRTLDDFDKARISEITMFIDTEITTTAHGLTGEVSNRTLVLDAKFKEPVEFGQEWKDLSKIVSETRVHGLAESFKTRIHTYQHLLRIELTLAAASRPRHDATLLINAPIVLHSNAATTVDYNKPPPY